MRKIRENFSEWKTTRRKAAESRRAVGTKTYQRARWNSPVRMWHERNMNRVVPTGPLSFDEFKAKFDSLIRVIQDGPMDKNNTSKQEAELDKLIIDHPNHVATIVSNNEVKRAIQETLEQKSADNWARTINEHRGARPSGNMALQNGEWE